MSASSTYPFWMGSFFDSQKLPSLVLLFGMVLAFLLIRVNTRLIRRGVSWWPGNIRRGKLHVHHMVLGLPAMFVVGLLEFAIQPGAPWAEILAFLFGGAAGAVFDEFALVLHLKDVYWERQGRQSIVAVFLGTSLTAFMAVGLSPLGYSDSREAAVLVGWFGLGSLLLNLVLVVVAFLKGRLWMGWVGIFVPLIAFVAAVRLARPWSPWARWRYSHKPARLARAEARAVRFDQRWGHWQRRIIDLIAGKVSGGPVSAADASAANDPTHQVEIPLALETTAESFSEA
jgi:lysyl-tRNA synthetase class 2